MNRAVYSYLFKTYGRRPGYWFSVVAVIIQTVLLRVATVIVVARLAGDITTRNVHDAKVNVLLYFLIGVCGLIARGAKELVGTYTENQVYTSLMMSYYQKLVGKDMAFYRDHQTGYLASTFRQHADSAMDLARLIRGEIIQTPISLIVPTVILFLMSWRVGCAALGVVIAQVVYITWSSSIANKHRIRSHEIYRQISGVVSDDVTNIVAYKTSGAGTAAMARMKELISQEIRTFWLRRKTVTLLDAPRELITISGTVLAYWFIVTTGESTSRSVGLVVLTITYMFQMYQAVTGLPDLIAHHDDFVSRLYPTLEYLTDKYETVHDKPRPKRLRISKGAVDVRHVSFAYQDTRGKAIPVFTDLNITIHGGEQIGVVGLSGAGKSTLASLLMRFDDIDGGAIKIDGIDIRDVAQNDLRRNIAFVPQEPLLFHRTIRENLLYFNGAISEEQMIRATKAAHAHEFIEKLPDGYDTLVGERGVKLSGGQKQRVVIARAILKDAPIMVFDEATSALDSESEKIIQAAMPQILGKRTALVIAHRLSTVASLDRIIVMHNGVVAEQGTHDELLKLKGRYYSLWQKQTNHA